METTFSYFKAGHYDKWQLSQLISYSQALYYLGKKTTKTYLKNGGFFPLNSSILFDLEDCSLETREQVGYIQS